VRGRDTGDLTPHEGLNLDGRITTDPHNDHSRTVLDAPHDPLDFSRLGVPLEHQRVHDHEGFALPEQLRCDVQYVDVGCVRPTV
jgi:hypothetical protein